MSLTPEQWRALDEQMLRIEQSAADMKAANEAADNLGLLDAMNRWGHAEYRMALLLRGGVLRTLIDAARPICEACLGRDYPTPCPDCNGTGWAA